MAPPAVSRGSIRDSLSDILWPLQPPLSLAELYWWRFNTDFYAACCACWSILALPMFGSLKGARAEQDRAGKEAPHEPLLPDHTNWLAPSIVHMFILACHTVVLEGKGIIELCRGAFQIQRFTFSPATQTGFLGTLLRMHTQYNNWILHSSEYLSMWAVTGLMCNDVSQAWMYDLSYYWGELKFSPGGHFAQIWY